MISKRVLTRYVDLQGAGAAALVTCAAGWWLFASIMLATLEFPFQLPVGDLSRLIKSTRQKETENRHEA